MSLFRQEKSPPADKPPHLARIVLFAVLAVSGFFVEFFMIGDFLRSQRVASWPSTDGVVLQSEFKPEFIGVLRYEADIRYSYTVGETPYTSSSVRVRGAASKNRSDIAALVERFPTGAVVPVYYNPADPSESFLEAGVDRISYVLIISPVVVGALMAYATIAMIRERRAHRRRRSGEE